MIKAWRLKQGDKLWIPGIGYRLIKHVKRRKFTRFVNVAIVHNEKIYRLRINRTRLFARSGVFVKHYDRHTLEDIRRFIA